VSRPFLAGTLRTDIMDFNDENNLAAETKSVKSADNSAPEVSNTSSPKNAGKKFDISEQGGLLFIVVILSVFLIIAFEQFVIRRGGAVSSQSSVETKKRYEKRDTERSEETSDGLDLARTLTQARDSIQEEIETVRREGGLPTQVFQRDIPPEENVGALIAKEFSSFDPNSYDRLRESISTQGPWYADWETIQTHGEVLARFKPQRDRLRELLDDPDAKFEQNLIGTNIGLVPDDQNVDSSWSYMTLEECEIARSLQEGNMDDAVETLRYMLRFTELAAQTQFPEMRIHAAYMRENTLRILQTLALDPKFTPKHANTIITILRRTLQNWPSDAKCWIGDRAEALRRFELIREGRISEALTASELDKLRSLDVLGVEIPKEKEQTRRERGLSLLNAVAFYKPQAIDKDQDYYLKAMRVLIDSCSQPFYARLETLDHVADNLQLQQGKKDYPALSMLFLYGIRESMQKQAMDKTRVEAWYLALASSLKLAVKEGAVDPVRGKPYIITRSQAPEGNRIVVTYGKNDGKVEVKEEMRNEK